MTSHHEGTKDAKATKLSLDDETERIASVVVDVLLKVYRGLGPGLLESAYEACLLHELKKRSLNCEAQKPISIQFEELRVDAAYRLDVLVEKRIILELKSVESLHPIHEAQLLTYLRLSGMRLGFLMNFNAPTFKDALKRKVW